MMKATNGSNGRVAGRTGRQRTARGVRVNAGVKAGGLSMQHNRTPAVKVNAGIKAGGLSIQHNRR